ncbi:MAG TPA: HD domain-containing protein [Prolixibacteraceae bacterium]|nr:HD domain-containing protein [Prolixibacteraceae bacterium]
MVPEVMQKMIFYFGDDIRRINHALKVYGFARCLAGLEGLDQEQIRVVEIAALLHDIGIKEAERKYQSTAGPYQEKEGPPVALGLLHDFPLERNTLDRIIYLIGNHHSYTKINGKDFQILVEADFLVNISEDEMPVHSIIAIRNRYFTTETGRSFLEKMYPGLS